jgi:hypothetical protein
MALVITDVSEEFSASFIRVKRIGELGRLAITSNRCMGICLCLLVLQSKKGISDIEELILRRETPVKNNDFCANEVT